MMRNLLRSERGTSLIEFALMAPVLILLVVGLIEVGRYMYFGVLAAHAAEAGVKYGAQNLNTAQDTSGMVNAAYADAANLPQWNATAKFLCSQNGAAAGTCTPGTPPPATVYYVSVKITGRFSPLIGYPGLAAQIPITATATMRVQNQ